MALRGLKQFKESEKVYKRVLEIDAANVESRYNLCVLKQEYTQELNDALTWCSDFLGRIDARHPKRKEVQNRVSGMEAAIEMMQETEAPASPEPETKGDVEN